MSIELMVRADDAAGSIAANTAIAEALLTGTVRNVSVMGCGSEAVWQDWTRRFFALPVSVRRQVDVGLHVTLNAEWIAPSVRFRPRSNPARVPLLVEAETGFFTPSPLDLHRRGWGQEQIEQSLIEVGAQLQRLRAAGLDPVYLDEHMGVGWLPGLREALLTFARGEGLLAAANCDLTGLPFAPVAVAANAKALANVYGAAIAAASAAAQSRPDAPRRFLVVAHPACDGPETRQFFNADITPGLVAVERERERQMLVLPGLAAQLAERGAVPVRYSDIGSVA